MSTRTTCDVCGETIFYQGANVRLHPISNSARPHNAAVRLRVTVETDHDVCIRCARSAVGLISSDDLDDLRGELATEQRRTRGLRAYAKRLKADRT